MSTLEQAIQQNDLIADPHSGTCELAQFGGATREKGFLGVLVDTFDLGNRLGASVVGTVAGSAAARINLAAGDTIISVCGIGLFSAIALGEEISNHHPGEHVTLTWITPQGSSRFARVRLSREPDAGSRATHSGRGLAARGVAHFEPRDTRAPTPKPSGSRLVDSFRRGALRSTRRAASRRSARRSRPTRNSSRRESPSAR